MADYKIYEEPLQRLNYVTNQDLKKIFIQVRLIVNLYKDEYIEKIPTVSMTGNKVTTTLNVEGTQTGGTDLYHFKYLIYAFVYTCDYDKVFIKGEIKEKLLGGVYSVTTIVKKNPQGTVTNTIDEDGDIDPKG